MAKRKTKRKQIVAWAVHYGGPADNFTTFNDRGEAVASVRRFNEYDDVESARVVRLLEVTPAEEAVLRAARSKAHDADLRLSRAIERMEAGDE